MSLSEEEALLYLRNKLNLTFPNSTWEEEFTKDKWGMLKKVYRKVLQENYFQNISLILNKSEPSRNSSIKSFIEGNGGVCIDNNFSLSVLLRALGYDTFVTSAPFLMEKNPDNHLCCMVRGDLPGELWALDSGCCQIFHNMIPLHKVKEGEPFSIQNGEYETQFRYKDNGVFHRVNMKGDYYHGKIDKDEELVQICSTVPREYDHFKSTMKIIFTEMENSILYQMGIVLSRYVELDDDNSFKYVVIWGLKFFEISNGATERKTFESYDEMWPTVKTHFPRITKSEYDEAARIVALCKNKKQE